MRPDTLSQILLHSNVHAGSNVLVYEEVGGLLVGALAERFGGAFPIEEAPYYLYLI